jgi:fumarylacetoacetase
MNALLPSWLDSANDPRGDFPLNNLPYGVFSNGDTAMDRARCGVAIGDFVLDLAALQGHGLLPDFGFDHPSLNPFMAHGPAAWDQTRRQITQLLQQGADATLTQSALHPLHSVRLHLPFTVTEFTDFYASRDHAFNVGSMFRGPENALPPNWLHMPIGYNGRASTVVVSGTDIRRPHGQLKPPEAQSPHFAPSQRLDFELELGAVIGQPSQIGAPITVDQADDMIFGYVLLNDWSARDIQVWEYQPLGPFQSKAFATTISPWIVPKAALDPFRRPAPDRAQPLLPHLADTGPMHYDIHLSIALAPPSGPQTVISHTNARHLYYSPAQQLTHHAACGCAMRVGDLLGSGTISGPEPSSFGSMLELAWNGARPLTLPGGESRCFLQDGDTVTLNGHAAGNGYRIGFGACTGTIIPAKEQKC